MFLGKLQKQCILKNRNKLKPKKLSKCTVITNSSLFWGLFLGGSVARLSQDLATSAVIRVSESIEHPVPGQRGAQPGCRSALPLSDAAEAALLACWALTVPPASVCGVGPLDVPRTEARQCGLFG